MPPSAAARTAVLVDEHPLWIESVERLLERTEVRVVLKASGPSEVLPWLEELEPDLLVTEVRMGASEIDGLQLIERARRIVPGLKAVVLSAYDDADHINDAFAAGASSYVVKTAGGEDLIAALRQTFQHSVFLPGRARLATPAAAPAAAHGLTTREVEILELVGEGHSNPKVARMLWVTEQTVKFHLSNIYRKLGVTNRTEASRWAQKHGLMTPPPPPEPSDGQVAA